jgi:hypothetical protein
MIKTIIIQALLIGSTILSFGQVNHSITIKSGENQNKSCHNPIENKAIGLCYLKADTLTYDQFKGCKELTTGDNNKQVITSYNLCYFLADGTTFSVKYVSGNQIPMDMVQTIVSSGIKKVIFDQITGIEGTENLALGYRCFYLK